MGNVIARSDIAGHDVVDAPLVAIGREQALRVPSRRETVSEVLHVKRRSIDVKIGDDDKEEVSPEEKRQKLSVVETDQLQRIQEQFSDIEFRPPYDDEHVSAYITGYLYPVAYMNRGRPMVLLSRYHTPLSRRLVNVEVDRMNNEIALIAADDSKAVLVHLTPYMMRIEQTEHNGWLTLTYPDDKPLIKTNRVGDGDGYLTNTEYAKRITYEETSLLELVPHVTLETWLPPDAYTRDNKPVPEAVRNSVIIAETCPNYVRLQAFLNSDELRNVSRNCTVFPHLQQLHADERDNLLNFESSLPYYRNANITANEQAANVFVEQMMRAGGPQNTLVFCFSVNHYARDDYILSRKTRQRPQYRYAHVVCVVSTFVPGDANHKERHREIYLFDSNGDTPLIRNIGQLLYQTYTTNVAPEQRTTDNLVIMRNMRQFLSYEYMNMKDEREAYSNAMQIRVVDQARHGRCQLWTMFLIYLFTRYTESQTPTATVRQLAHLSPHSHYHLLTFFGSYILLVTEGRF